MGASRWFKALCGGRGASRRSYCWQAAGIHAWIDRGKEFEGGSSGAEPAGASGRMGHPDRGDGLALELEVRHVVSTM
jgi:hypothetical protein